MNDGEAPGYFPVFDHIAARKDLTPNAKMLFGLLYNLTRREGYAWASNSFLAERLGTQPRQIRNILNELHAASFIDLSFEQEGGTKRRIYVNSTGGNILPPVPNSPKEGEANNYHPPGNILPFPLANNCHPVGSILPPPMAVDCHQLDNLNKLSKKLSDEIAKPKTCAPALEPLDSPEQITQPPALALASARLVRKSLSTCESEFASLPDEKKRGYFDTAESDLAGLGISPGKLPPAAVERRAISLYMTEQNTQSAAGA